MDKWLQKAIHEWHNCVEKGPKEQKGQNFAPTAPATKVVIVPFDCEQGNAPNAGDGDLTFLGIDPSEIDNEFTVDDSDDKSEATNPKTGGTKPLGPNPGSIPVLLGNPGPPPPPPPPPANTAVA